MMKPRLLSHFLHVLYWRYETEARDSKLTESQSQTADSVFSICLFIQAVKYMRTRSFMYLFFCMHAWILKRHLIIYNVIKCKQEKKQKSIKSVTLILNNFILLVTSMTGPISQMSRRRLSRIKVLSRHTTTFMFIHQQVCENK